LFLLCGLGNKGSAYRNTRHNIGFIIIDRFSERFSIALRKRICNCRVGIYNNVALAKPNTYMNLSGGPVSALIREMDISLENVVIIHDDIDMEFGKIRIKWDGKDGGHKGVRSIIEALGTPSFYRLKIGIGRDPLVLPEDYVLSKFTEAEIPVLKETIERAVDAAHTFFFQGRAKAMSIYNRNI